MQGGTHTPNFHSLMSLMGKVLPLYCPCACHDMSPARCVVQTKQIVHPAFKASFILPTQQTLWFFWTAQLCVWRSASCVFRGRGFPLLFLHQWGDRGFGHARRVLCYPMPGIQLALPHAIFSRQHRNATPTVRPLLLHDLLLAFIDYVSSQAFQSRLMSFLWYTCVHLPMIYLETSQQPPTPGPSAKLAMPEWGKQALMLGL